MQGTPGSIPGCGTKILHTAAEPVPQLEKPTHRNEDPVQPKLIN